MGGVRPGHGVVGRAPEFASVALNKQFPRLRSARPITPAVPQRLATLAFTHHPARAKTFSRRHLRTPDESFADMHHTSRPRLYC
jgi:hypothetical protein